MSEVVRFNLLVPKNLMVEVENCANELGISKAQIMVLGTKGFIAAFQKEGISFVGELVKAGLLQESDGCTHAEAVKRLRESGHPRAEEMAKALEDWRNNGSKSSKDPNMPSTLQGWDGAASHGSLYETFGPIMREIIWPEKYGKDKQAS